MQMAKGTGRLKGAMPIQKVYLLLKCIERNQVAPEFFIPHATLVESKEASARINSQYRSGHTWTHVASSTAAKSAVTVPYSRVYSCSNTPCLHFDNGPVTWSTTAAWITLTAGPKHAATFCMISDLYYELHQGGWVWFWGFASELELARWGAVHPANSLAV
jgi:hypothetical protein